MINVNFSFKKTELLYIITENQQNSFKMSPGVHKCGIIIVWDRSMFVDFIFYFLLCMSMN